MYFILGIILLVAVLLILLVLIQNSKGGGLTSQFTGAGAGQLLGVKRTGDLLEQLTWGFISAMIVLSLASHFFVTPAEASETRRSVNKERATEKAGSGTFNPKPAPQAPPPATDTTK
jgi:preprotein translocase subunit SecG